MQNRAGGGEWKVGSQAQGSLPVHLALRNQLFLFAPFHGCQSLAKLLAPELFLSSTQGRSQNHYHLLSGRVSRGASGWGAGPRFEVLLAPEPRVHVGIS